MVWPIPKEGGGADGYYQPKEAYGEAHRHYETTPMYSDARNLAGLLNELCSSHIQVGKPRNLIFCGILGADAFWVDWARQVRMRETYSYEYDVDFVTHPYYPPSPDNFDLIVSRMHLSPSTQKFNPRDWLQVEIKANGSVVVVVQPGADRPQGVYVREDLRQLPMAVGNEAGRTISDARFVLTTNRYLPPSQEQISRLDVAFQSIKHQIGRP